MSKPERKLTLDEPAAYQIRVPGVVDERWSDWAERMTLAVETEADGRPATTLTGIVDQAALQGVLRRLYSLGLPVISVSLVEEMDNDKAGHASLHALPDLEGAE